jgi:signal transduction histidine kinase
MVAAHQDSALPASSQRARFRLGLPAGRGVRLAFLVAWASVLVLGFLATVDAFGRGNDFAAAAWTSGLWMVGLTIAGGLRDVRAAEARTNAALQRAVAAETAQRARADELSEILRASEGLVLTGEGRLDFVSILAAITPVGCTSFLARVDGESESVVVAAHGPLAPWLIGLRRSVDPAAEAANRGTSPLTSYSARGRFVGTPTGQIDLPEMDAEIAAALSVRLVDHTGLALGWLNLLDSADERILDPSFVSLAQLVANQIGVAMENQALLARVQRQLVEVQRVQKQLVRATKLGAVGELAAAVAHEVNNPLTGILGFSELLLAELPVDDPRHQEASIIQAEAVRARSIIRSLLEFARPRPPQRIPSDINQLVESTLELLRFRSLEAGVRVAADYGKVPTLEIDPDAFKQVLLNLLNNAVDAMPQGGELHVFTRTEDDRLRIVVADNGIGMDAATRNRIFTPFFSTKAAAGGGTGLGLSVSLQIVEGHGGTIAVESEPGEGATFTVWLPLSWPAFEGAVIVPGGDPGSIAGNVLAAATGAPDADDPTRPEAVDGRGRRGGVAA